MTYREAVAYLESFANYEAAPSRSGLREVKLERMQALCRALGDPQRSYRSVIVGGTNGKGSVCAMLYAMLRQGAIRSGLYSSPHLEHLRERIRVSPGVDGKVKPSSRKRAHNDDWIPEGAFAAVMRDVRTAVEAVRQGEWGAPTYFEILTAAALVHFQRCRIEVAVLEVGLGGRLDATNVADAAVAVICPVDLDHTEVLGATREAIAAEKAGIIKPGRLVLSAPQAPEVEAVLRRVCEEQGAAIAWAGRDLTAAVQRHSFDGLELSLTGLRGVHQGLTLPLIGRHQALNAALAVGALEALSPTGVPHALVVQGLANAEWPGRMERVHEKPLVLMDGAHNAHAAAALAGTLTELCEGRRIHLLVGMSSDKSPEALGQALGKLSVSVTCTRAAHPRAMDPMELARRLKPYCPDVHVMSDPADAFTYVLNAVAPADVIVVTGSLFLVGQLRSAWRQAHVRPRRTPAQLQAA